MRSLAFIRPSWVGTMHDGCKAGDNKGPRVCVALAPKQVWTLALALVACTPIPEVPPGSGSESDPTVDETSTSTSSPTPTTGTTEGPDTTEAPTTSTGIDTDSENQAPSVNIDVLQAGVPVELPAVISTPSHLEIKVSASDPEGMLTGLEVALDGTTLTQSQEDSVVIPWAVVSSSQNSDPVTITAVATDDQQQQANDAAEVIVNLNPGTQVWETISDNSDPTEFRALTFNSQGQIIVAGRLHAAGGTGVSRLYVDILDPLDGSSLIAGTDFEEGEDIEAFGVAVDPFNDDVLVTGRLVVNNTYRPFYRRLQREGNVLTTAATHVFDEDDQEGCGLAIATDADGGVYVTGFTGVLDVASRTFVAKLVDDSQQWLTKVESLNEMSKRGAGFDIVYAHDQRLYVAGVATVAGHEVVRVTQLEATGGMLATWTSPGDNEIQRAEARAIAVKPSGEIVAGGLRRQNSEHAVNLFQGLELVGGELQPTFETTSPLLGGAAAKDRIVYGLDVSQELLPGRYDIAVAATIDLVDNIDQVEPTPEAWVSDFNDTNPPWWQWYVLRENGHAFDIGWGPDGYHYTAGYLDTTPRRAWVRKSIP